MAKRTFSKPDEVGIFPISYMAKLRLSEVR